MLSAYSLLRCRRVPFKTQATSSFIAPRLFRTSINRSTRQTNTKYASPSPLPPQLARIPVETLSLLGKYNSRLAIAILKVEIFFISSPRKGSAITFFFGGFALYSFCKTFYVLWTLVESPSPWIMLAGYAIAFGPIYNWINIGPSKISELCASPWRLIRFTTKVLLYWPLYVSIMIADIIVLEIISSYPKYPPHIDKDLKNPSILGSLNNSISKDSFTSYQYEVLPEGYIRLVHIKPGKPEDPIELELKSIRFRPFKLTGWIPEKPVMVNGQPFYITANLHSALLAIRRNPISLPLWIDAICIDQEDNVEKEQQLRIMHQIYKNATNVRVWLGKDDQSVDVRAALTLMSHCLTQFEQVRGRSNSQLWSDWDILYFTSWSAVMNRVIFWTLVKLPFILEEETDFENISGYFREDEKKPIVQKIDWHTGPEYSSDWKAIKNILTRSYFTRSWIIQEIVIASNRSIFVGDYDVTDILRFVELLYANPEIEGQLPFKYRIEPELISRIHNLIRGIVEYQDVMNLGELLATFRGKGSKLPHDQVYSLLGLLRENNQNWLMPSKANNLHVRFPEINYKQSIQKLCTDTTKYILVRHNNLDALRMLNTHAKPPTNGKDWPSWVPDFTSPLPELGQSKKSYWRLPPRSLLRTELPREKTDIRFENDKLLVHGHVLSEIREPIGVESTGQRNKELENEKQRIGERHLPILEVEFLPITVWRDSEGREIRGPMGVKKGDLVVVVARSENPLILRRLKDVQGGGKRKENEWPEYNIVGTAHIPVINHVVFNRLAKKILWDFQKMAII